MTEKQIKRLRNTSSDHKNAAIIRNNKNSVYSMLIKNGIPNTWSARMPAYYGTSSQASYPKVDDSGDGEW